MTADVPPAKLAVHQAPPLDVEATSSANFKLRAPILPNSKFPTVDPLLLEKGEIAQIAANPIELDVQTSSIVDFNIVPCLNLVAEKLPNSAQVLLAEREEAATVAADGAAGKWPTLTLTSAVSAPPSTQEQFSPSTHKQPTTSTQGPVPGPKASTAPKAPVPTKSNAEATSTGHSNSAPALGSVDRSLEIPEAIFSLSERAQASTDFKHAVVRKFSFRKPKNQPKESWKSELKEFSNKNG